MKKSIGENPDFYLINLFAQIVKTYENNLYFHTGLGIVILLALVSNLFTEAFVF